MTDIVGIGVGMRGQNFSDADRQTKRPAFGFGSVADLSALFHADRENLSVFSKLVSGISKHGISKPNREFISRATCHAMTRFCAPASHYPIFGVLLRSVDNATVEPAVVRRFFLHAGECGLAFGNPGEEAMGAPSAFRRVQANEPVPGCRQVGCALNQIRATRNDVPA